jgi:hypothetical protein
VTCGRGRAVWLPRPAAAAPLYEAAEARVSEECWKLPPNHAELVAAVDWAARGDFAVTVTAPATVAVELAYQPASGRLLLHLVNYDFERPVADLEVSLRLPPGAVPGALVLESPDIPQPLALKGASAGGRLLFGVPRLAVYNLISVEARTA